MIHIDKITLLYEGYVPMDRSHLMNNESFDTCGGENLVFLKGVYSFVEDCLLPSCQNKVLLKTEVVNIKWSGNLVEVITPQKVYSADHVIFTPSTGVLKAAHDELFTPRLPADKVTAFDTQPFGQCEKAFLFFDEVWWSQPHMLDFLTVEVYDLITSNDDVSLQQKMSSLVGEVGI